MRLGPLVLGISPRPAALAAVDELDAGMIRCHALTDKRYQSITAARQPFPRRTGGDHGQGKGRALDQPRQGAARQPEDVAGVLRVEQPDETAEGGGTALKSRGRPLDGTATMPLPWAHIF